MCWSVGLSSPCQAPPTSRGRTIPSRPSDLHIYRSHHAPLYAVSFTHSLLPLLQLVLVRQFARLCWQWCVARTHHSPLHVATPRIGADGRRLQAVTIHQSCHWGSINRPRSFTAAQPMSSPSCRAALLSRLPCFSSVCCVLCFITTPLGCPGVDFDAFNGLNYLLVLVSIAAVGCLWMWYICSTINIDGADLKRAMIALHESTVRRQYNDDQSVAYSTLGCCNNTNTRSNIAVKINQQNETNKQTSTFCSGTQAGHTDVSTVKEIRRWARQHAVNIPLPGWDDMPQLVVWLWCQAVWSCIKGGGEKIGPWGHAAVTRVCVCVCVWSTL